MDPDPLVRGMDPRILIRIRIHPKMSWIRNTAFNHAKIRQFDSTKELIKLFL
jgi:hypothetical protein